MKINYAVRICPERDVACGEVFQKCEGCPEKRLPRAKEAQAAVINNMSIEGAAIASTKPASKGKP